MAQHDELAMFCAVAELHGFSPAARRLQVTKSAVSKAVQRLETRLETRLLHRTTRKISLTEAGEAFYRHARRALAEAAAAEDAVASLGGAPRGRIRLAAPMSFGLTVIAAHLPDFMVRYPGLSVDLQLGDRRVDIVAGGYDLAVRVGELPDSNMVALPIGHMPAVLVAAPAYLRAHAAPECLADLHRHECLHYSYELGAHVWHFDGPDGHETVRLEGRYQVNSSIALRTAALAGLGVSRIPLYLVKDDLATGRLVQLLPGYSMDRGVINAVLPERGFIPQKVRLLADFLKASLAADQHMDAATPNAPNS